MTERQLSDGEIVGLARIASASNNYSGGRWISAEFSRDDLIAFARAVLSAASPIALEALELVAMQPATRGVYLLDQQDMDFVKRAVKALKEQA